MSNDQRNQSDFVSIFEKENKPLSVMTLLYIYIHFFSSIVYIEHLCDVYVELQSHVFTAAADDVREKILQHVQIGREDSAT